MKIDKIEGYFLYAKFDQPLGNAMMWFDGKLANIIKMYTSDGVVGYGEAFTFNQELLFQTMTEIFPLFKNFEYRDWSDISGKLDAVGSKYPLEIKKRIESALNIAYWDIKGKVEGKAVCELFGCKPKKNVPVYGTGLFYRDVPNHKDQLAAFQPEIRTFIDRKYHGIKMKAGRYQAKDEFWLINAVREQLPAGMKLMADANCGMKSMEETLKLVGLLEQIDFVWLEEPFAPSDYASYKTLCGKTATLPVAAGENEYALEGIVKLIDCGVKVIQPELSLIGGFTGACAVLDTAKQRSVQLTPHVWGSGVLYSTTLNFYSMLGPEHTLYYEHPFADDPLRNACFTNLDLKDGCIDTPAGPGLGIGIDEAALKHYTVQTV